MRGERTASVPRGNPVQRMGLEGRRMTSESIQMSYMRRWGWLGSRATRSGPYHFGLLPKSSQHWEEASERDGQMSWHRPHWPPSSRPRIHHSEHVPQAPFFLGVRTSFFCCYGSAGGNRKAFVLETVRQGQFGSFCSTLWSSPLSLLTSLATISMSLRGISAEKIDFSLGIGSSWSHLPADGNVAPNSHPTRFSPALRV